MNAGGAVVSRFQSLRLFRIFSTKNLRHETGNQSLTACNHVIPAPKGAADSCALASPCLEKKQALCKIVAPWKINLAAWGNSAGS